MMPYRKGMGTPKEREDAVEQELGKLDRLCKCGHRFGEHGSYRDCCLRKSCLCSHFEEAPPPEIHTLPTLEKELKSE